MQSKPKEVLSKQIFLVLFYYLLNNRNPDLFINCPRQLREKIEYRVDG